MSRVRRKGPQPLNSPAFFGLFLVVPVGQLGIEPEASVSPVPFDGCKREVQRLGDFRHGQAGEEAELDHLGLDRVVRGQTGQSLIKGRQVLDKFNCAGCHLVRPGIYDLKESDPLVQKSLKEAYRSVQRHSCCNSSEKENE